MTLGFLLKKIAGPQLAGRLRALKPAGASQGRASRDVPELESHLVSALVISGCLPPGLTVDIYDSRAWLGVTPFIVEKLRPPLLASLPWLSRFPETNVRTYVVGPDSSRGIWFFTLEAARGAAVAGATAVYGLPYRWASMDVRQDGGNFHYWSRRGEATTDIVVEPGLPAETTGLELFLTARFRLFSFRNKRLRFADVEHEPWPLKSARGLKINQTLLRSLSIDEPRGDPMIHHSTGVRTLEPSGLLRSSKGLI